ncbi:unnamed protein product [Brassicogethes aeneus]|uniref:C2H2-type domain-containing protein n=1 Tax=Brassicogethes aeneus TaxID=1431903 RepID=A0A9P0BG19_BRAAE|nr:unnamed protein product [Brassicogethes aeneus]
MEQIMVKKEPAELVDNSKGDNSMNYAEQEMSSEQAIKIEQMYIKQEIKEELDDVLLDKGYNSLTADMFKNASDSNLIFLNSLPSTSADQEMPSTSVTAIKQEIKEELEYDEAVLYGGFNKNNNRDNCNHGDLLCNIKKEEVVEDTNSSLNEEIDEVEEMMIEKKIEVEYHPVKYDDESGKEKLFECGLCPKKFVTKKGLFNHKNLHRKDGLKKLKCSKCGYATLRKENFKAHLRIHDKNKYLKCHFCEYMAAQLQALNAHMLSKHRLENKGENEIKITSKIHQCPKCLYSSVRKANYDNHIKVCLKLENVILSIKEDTVKWYKCEICHYKTIKKSNLIKHRKTHNKIKELKCLFCLHQCNVKINLDNHILTNHSELLNESNQNLITSKMHCCKHCNYKTTYANDLNKHSKRHH